MVSTSKDEQPEAFRVTLGARLRAIRERSGRSQREAAEGAGISQPALSSYERGVQSMAFEVAVALAAVYGVDVGELVEAQP